MQLIGGKITSKLAAARAKTKHEWISNMKITRQKLKQIITEELDDLEQDLYPGADELSFEDRDKFVEAYNIIGKAVESGALPESVEDAVFDMLGKLGIHL